MKRNVRYIDDLLSTLKKSKKYLNEAYVFEDDFNQEQDMYGENPYGGEEGYEEKLKKIIKRFDANKKK